MIAIVEFFESVIKKDHAKKDNKLYKTREKYDEISKKLEKDNLTQDEREKLSHYFHEAEKKLNEERNIAKIELIPQWINHFYEKSDSISAKPFIWSTHVSKFTDANNDYRSLDSDQYVSNEKTLITTSSIKNKIHDLAHGNGNQINLSRFLLVKDDEQETVFEKIKRGDVLWLDIFFQENKKKLEIVAKLNSLISNADKKCNPYGHKQIYFPLSENPNSNYHLIIPLFPSSFCHFLFERTKVTDQSRHRIRKAKKSNKYCQGVSVEFQKLGVVIMGGTKPHNISPLNSVRFGQVPLLRSVPPQWQTQTKPPVHLKSLFSKQLADQAREPLTELKNLLLVIKANTLSVNLQRKQLIRNHIADIADVVFDYAAQIHGLKRYVGWSQDSQLPDHQQYWLDPLRPDADFQTAKATLDWSNDIVIDFSKWINRQIKHKQLTLGVAHEKQWQKLFAPLLREFNALAEVDLETKAVEEKV